MSKRKAAAFRVKKVLPEGTGWMCWWQELGPDGMPQRIVETTSRPGEKQVTRTWVVKEVK